MDRYNDNLQFSFSERLAYRVLLITSDFKRQYIPRSTFKLQMNSDGQTDGWSIHIIFKGKVRLKTFRLIWDEFGTTLYQVR